ncbi:DUF4872 domain-containing protein, partial [Nonomuraea sp. NN258]|uniref:BtrH N-terminal domain-containing protein n=1 Tax=Nonomuraea antri TaxID=2730852 RepID=UPI001569DD06
MTAHKHLKSHVRLRMAKTGESYTTALRHVLARRPDTRPAAVLPGYTRFGGGLHHESATLSHVLAQAGIPLSEALLAGLGGGVGFMYFVFEYAGHHPMMTIVSQAHPRPMLPQALDQAGIAYEVKRTGGAKTAERNLRATLAAGRAAVCRLEREVAVAGIDGDTLYVDDQYVEPYPWPLADFLTAWSAPRKNRHHLLAVTGDGHRDLGAAARDAIADTVARLTGPVLGNNFDVNFGLSGMRKLAAQLGDTKARDGWARRFAAPEAFFIGLTRLHDCLEIEYGAPGAMRPLYADFLDEVGAAGAAGVYRRAGAAWSALARAALPGDVPQFARYREIAAERELLRTTDRVRGAGRLRELDAEAAALPQAYAAGRPLAGGSSAGGSSVAGASA